jgi:hypothetical protein
VFQKAGGFGQYLVRHWHIIHWILFAQFSHNAYMALYIQHRSAFVSSAESKHWNGTGY